MDENQVYFSRFLDGVELCPNNGQAIMARPILPDYLSVLYDDLDEAITRFTKVVNTLRAVREERSPARKAPAFERIARAVAKLNEGCDEACAKIRQFEKALADLSVKTSAQVVFDYGCHSYKIIYYMLNGRWRLGYTFGDRGEPIGKNLVKPLDQAPRAVRIEATKHLDKLAEKIAEAVEQQVREA